MWKANCHKYLFHPKITSKNSENLLRERLPSTTRGSEVKWWGHFQQPLILILKLLFNSDYKIIASTYKKKSCKQAMSLDITHQKDFHFCLHILICLVLLAAVGLMSNGWGTGAGGGWGRGRAHPFEISPPPPPVVSKGCVESGKFN